MEKLANEVSRKDQLIQRSENIYSKIGNQIEEIKEKSGQVAKTAVIIGGVLFVTYLIVRRFSRKSSKENTVEIDGRTLKLAPVQRESVIVRMIREYIAVFLISIAKQKLKEILSNMNMVETTEETQAEEL